MGFETESTTSSFELIHYNVHKDDTQTHADVVMNRCLRLTLFVPFFVALKIGTFTNEVFQILFILLSSALDTA